MTESQKAFATMLAELESLPFLFIGSGISQRYTGAESWEKLLRLFANYAYDGKEQYAYEKFRYSEKMQWNDTPEYERLPKMASLISEEFNRIWFISDRWEKSRKESGSLLYAGITPFKIELANHFKNKEINYSNQTVKNEILKLQQLGEDKIAGIITTNYDPILESIFDKYNVFVGQDELLFNPSYGISEIYKIHGSCSDPKSIVITAEDYRTFQEKQAYLTAKLITIFVEHPIIFLGYSISDLNIAGIIKSIAECLSDEKREILQNRFFFVDYTEKHLNDFTITSFEQAVGENRRVSMQKIIANDFSLIYDSISQLKRKYPTKILYTLKKDIYELVKNNDPSGRLFVRDMEEVNSDDTAFDYIMGVGVIHSIGYIGLDREALFHDVIYDNQNYDSDKILNEAIRSIKTTTSARCPVYKYLSKTEKQNPYSDVFKVEDFFGKKDKERREKGKLVTHFDEDLLETISRCIFLDYESIGVDILKDFLVEACNKYPFLIKPSKQKGADGSGAHKSKFKKMVLIYDWLRYAKKEPSPHRNRVKT